LGDLGRRGHSQEYADSEVAPGRQHRTNVRRSVIVVMFRSDPQNPGAKSDTALSDWPS
jgi:hypothetical protein